MSPKPFWIGVGFVKPHMPHVFPSKYLEQVPKKADIQLCTNPLPPAGVAAAMDWNSGTGANGPVIESGPPFGDVAVADNDTARDWKQNYYAAAAFSDDLFGQLLAELKVHKDPRPTSVLPVLPPLHSLPVRRLCSC